jgi:hypothetical protein
MVTKQAAAGICELFVFGELLKQGVAVYKPLVEQGLDALVRLPDGQVLELRIKSVGGAGGKGPGWFQMPPFVPRPNFFIVCVAFSETKVGEVWVFPSTVFSAYASGREDKTRDLNLESGIRKFGEPLREYLRGFRNRWELIVDYSEYQHLMNSPEGYKDLEDIVTALESFEEPEEDRIPWEEYSSSLSDALPD